LADRARGTGRRS